MSDRKCNKCGTMLSHREYETCLVCEAQSELAQATGSATDRTLTIAQECCEQIIEDLRTGDATLRGETLEAFERLCTQCGISTIRISG